MTEHTVIAVKAAAGDGDTWELDVLGVPYGGPNGGRDSDGEYFSAQQQTNDNKGKARNHHFAKRMPQFSYFKNAYFLV
jgi:hypothetical protein